jgi:hypothetical protein
VRRHRHAANNIFFIAALAIAASSLSGCAMFAPKDYSKLKEGEWQGKALVRDKVQAKTGIINLKIKAIDNEKLRMDVTSPVGTHLASLMIIGGDVQVLNISEKTLYKTKSSREALTKLMHLPLEPSILYNILFDHPVANKSWSCGVDSSGFVKNCKELKSGITIEWTRREGIKRGIEIRHSSATVQMNLDGFEAKISEPEKAFQLKAPPSFQVKNL